MAAAASKLYRYHVENLRSLEVALGSTSRSARAAIACGDKSAIQSFVRLYAFLLGAWAETRLRKLLYEGSGFSASHRKRVLDEGTQLDQWKKAVELGFRVHYGKPRAAIQPGNFPATAAFRYHATIAAIDEWLGPTISVRNKLAHGQWVYPLNSTGTDIAQDMYVPINKENLLALQYKMALLKELAQLAHELIASPPTFERDFDLRFDRIAGIVTNLESRRYEDYAANLVQKRARGVERRRAGKGAPTKASI